MPVVRRTKFCYENKSSLSCFCFDRYLIAETSQLPRETLRFAKAFRLRQWRVDWAQRKLSARENKENRREQAVRHRHERPDGSPPRFVAGLFGLGVEVFLRRRHP